MRAYQVNSADGIESIEKVELPEPEAGPGQVKIRLRAASLNYRDLSVSQGGYLRNDTRPVIPLSDGAGEVVAVGSGVTRWRVGDRVTPIFVRDWIDGQVSESIMATCLGGGIDGVLAEYAVFPAASLVAVPEDWDDAEAATLPCAAVTAWHALFEGNTLLPGQTVLLLGTGGVSIFALQLAKAAGAHVIITSSSDDKLARAQEMGADAVVNYREHPEWHKEVKRLTNGAGVDHVVEVGGPGTLERSLKSCKLAGRVHLIGVLDTPEGKVGPLLSVFNMLTIRGIYVGSRAMHERLVRAMVADGLRPVVDAKFKFDDAVEAYRAFSKQTHFGKVVIEWP